MSGFLILDLSGADITAQEIDIIKHPLVRGLLLFSRNYENKQQLINLIQKVRENTDNDFLIMVDHEGGRVWRFHEGFTKIPKMKVIGEIYKDNKKEGLELAYNSAHIIAKELFEVGIDLSLAPVLDIDYGQNSVIGDRAFSDDINITIDLARSFIKGFSSIGMAATGKHFPGHGWCKEDSHFDLAVDERSYSEIFSHDIQIFKSLITELKAIMPSHVLYKNVDKYTTCYSKKWLKECLREEIGFKGVIISDCLSMKSAALDLDMKGRVLKAKDAGCDLVILAQQSRMSIVELLVQLEKEDYSVNDKLINTLKGTFEGVVVNE